MSFIAVAVGGISAVAGGLLSYAGSKAQAGAVKDSSAAAIAETQRQYDQNRADLAPWRDNGGAANNTLAYLEGVGPNGAPPDGTNSSQYGSLLKDFQPGDLQNDPGYQFERAQGSQALERSAAAHGTLFSGGTLKALTQYNNDYAGTKYNEAFNRFNTNKLNRYNMLAGLSAGGQQAAANTVQAGTNAANNISNITVNAGEQIGNARASGYAGIGQAINSGLNTGLNLYYAKKT